MREVTGDLWFYDADVRVITTNGTIKKDGSCVMGRGCALEAKKRYPGIDKTLGEMLMARGNHVHWVWGENRGSIIFTFPVKHNWYEKADIELIRRSAEELSVAVAPFIKVIVMPRPGCGNGGLTWCYNPHHEDCACSGVKHVIEDVLDDRFHVITFRRS